MQKTKPRYEVGREFNVIYKDYVITCYKILARKWDLKEKKWLYAIRDFSGNGGWAWEESVSMSAAGLSELELYFYETCPTLPTEKVKQVLGEVAARVNRNWR